MEYMDIETVKELDHVFGDIEELQKFRCLMMQYECAIWASLEHKLKYKKDIDNAQVISQDLCFCAELISQLDGRMQQIRERLEEKKDDTQANITGV